MARPAKSQTEPKVLFSFHDGEFKVKEGVLYKVENKYDATAPDGLKRLLTTKVPSVTSLDSITCSFTNIGGGKGVYDTGFFESSPCHNGLSPQDRKVEVKNLLTNVAHPYEKKVGMDELLMQNNYDFWDNYFVDLEEGKVFDTSDPQDVLALYIAVKEGALCPKGQEGNPDYNQASYVVVDTDSSKTARTQIINHKFQAIQHFGNLLEKNPKNLETVLKSMDIITLHAVSSSDAMQTAFSMWLEKDPKNAERFEKVYSEAVAGEDEMEHIRLTVKVKELMNKGRIKREGANYVFEDVPVGIDVRDIVRNLEEKEELSEIHDKIRLSK